MNQVVVLTGASRGLGLHLARKLTQRGDRVFGVSKTKSAWVSARKFVDNEKSFSLFQVDATNEKEVQSFISSVVEAAKQIDILINNAGTIIPLTRVEDVSLSDFQAQLSENLTSQFLFCKHALPHLRKQKKGLIVNLSSMAGKRAVPRVFPYSASKAGVLALSQCIAKENDDSNIKCVTVCPGGINTDMRRDLFGPEDAAAQQTPDFVANTIMDVIDEKIEVDSGGDIVIRHGRISAINPVPSA
jgi:NAD(P)-dependent dehydrogenase (short-subunit alcohol dehydrogenase family)